MSVLFDHIIILIFFSKIRKFNDFKALKNNTISFTHKTAKPQNPKLFAMSSI